MDLEYAKENLIERYKYLYINAEFILAPFMYMQSEKEFEKSKKEYNISKPLCFLYLNQLHSINSYLEEFMLSDISIEDTKLYKFIEENRNNHEYNEKVKYGLLLLEKSNENLTVFLNKLDIFKIIETVIYYVSEQSSDLDNKDRKLKLLDEYYKIATYKNNGKIDRSSKYDYIKEKKQENSYLKRPLRKKKDIGVEDNYFIETITNAPHLKENDSVFSEKEKQEVYLSLHDELPWDLEVECSRNNNDVRPNFSCPCHQKFYIKENEIFMKPREFNPIEFYDKYYQVCPHCGYIVELSKEIIAPEIRKRIEKRSLNDMYLYRKMWLYSELFALENIGPQHQKKLILK